MTFPKDSMIEHILPILHDASNAILEVYSDESKFNTQTKEDQSPLTEADKRSNEIIIEKLLNLYPDVHIISEELKESPYAARAHYEKYFLIDPLDGTKEFIKRNGEFTINIAFMEGKRPVGGFIYVPVAQTAYVAEKGNGAYKIDKDGTITELRSQTFFLLDKGLKIFVSRSHRDALTDKIVSMLNEPEILTSGSSLKFMKIAEGEAHFYPRLAPTMEWDTAAAQCILEEAGGSVIRFDDLLPVEYNKENLLSPYFIAMGSLLDPEALRDLIEEVKSKK